MPKILVEPTWCYLDPSPEEADVLDSALAIRVPGAQYSAAYRNGYWDGKRRFFFRRAGRFPTGLLPFVVRVLKSARTAGRAITSIKFRDARTTWPDGAWASAPRPILPPLRPYQHEAATAALTHRLGPLPFRQGLIVIPTGGGKTRVAVEIAARCRGRRVLVLVHRRLLLDQLAGVFSRSLRVPRRRFTQLGDLRKVYGQSRVGFAMVQTATALFRRRDREFLRWLQGVEVLLVDEVHRVNDRQYFPLLQAVPATVRIGFSATPLRRHDVGDVSLLGAIGPVLYRIRPEPLYRDNLLAQPTIRWITIGSTPDDDTPYVEARTQYLVHHPQRNARLVDVALDAVAQGWPTLILVRSIRHGAILRGLLRRARPSLPVLYLYGQTDLVRRRRAMRLFERGRVPVLIGSTILSEGIDLPSIGCLIIAGGGKSEIETLQRVGRGMRPKPDGGGLVVYDVDDQTNRYLAQHSAERRRAYAEMGYAQERVSFPS